MSCGEVDGDDSGEVKGDDSSGVVATGNIGRLNGCSSLILRAYRVATTGDIAQLDGVLVPPANSPLLPPANLAATLDVGSKIAISTG